jgi:hypothetical protein
VILCTKYIFFKIVDTVVPLAQQAKQGTVKTGAVEQQVQPLQPITLCNTPSAELHLPIPSYQCNLQHDALTHNCLHLLIL